MKRLLLIAFIVFFSQSLTSQKISLISENEDYRAVIISGEFEYIDYQMDMTNVGKFAAGYELTIDKAGENNLMKSFDSLWKTANKRGANAFSIEKIDFEDEKYIVSINTYYLDNDQMQQNFSYYEDNIIVVFGDLNTKNEDKEKTFKADKEKISLLPYHYAKFQNEPGKKVKLSIGGLMGTSVTIKGVTDRLGECYTLGGFGIGGVSVHTGTAGTGVGLNFKTGSIYPMNLNFGLFVMTILDTVENMKNISTDPENLLPEDAENNE